MKIKRWLIATGLAALAIAFAISGTALAQTDTQLEEVQWTLASLDGRDASRGQEVTLYLSDGDAVGSTGCNSYAGAYELEGKSLVFAPEMAITLADCDGAAQRTEAAFLSLLPETTEWATGDGTLRLADVDGVTLLTFVQSGVTHDTAGLREGLPEGLLVAKSVQSVVGTLPEAPAHFRLSRLVIAPGGLVDIEAVTDAGLLWAESGDLVIGDEFGVDNELPEGASLSLAGSDTLTLRSDGGATLLLSSLVRLEEQVPALPSAEVLLEADLASLPAPPARLFIAHATLTSGAAVEQLLFAGPVGGLVTSGTLSLARDVSGAGSLSEGESFVLPMGSPSSQANSADDQAALLLAGVIPAWSGLVETWKGVGLDGPAPSAEPNLEPIPTPSPLPKPKKVRVDAKGPTVVQVRWSSAIKGLSRFRVERDGGAAARRADPKERSLLWEGLRPDRKYCFRVIAIADGARSESAEKCVRTPRATPRPTPKPTPKPQTKPRKTPRPVVDAVIAGCSYPKTAAPGSSISVSVTVKNTGNIGAYFPVIVDLTGGGGWADNVGWVRPGQSRTLRLMKIRTGHETGTMPLTVVLRENGNYQNILDQRTYNVRIQ